MLGRKDHVYHMRDFKLHLKDVSLGTDDQSRMKGLAGYRKIRQEVTWSSLR